MVGYIKLAGFNNWMLSIQISNPCWHAVVTCQFCFALHTAPLSSVWNDTKLWTFSVFYGGLLGSLPSRLLNSERRGVCVRNNSPCGKMIPELSGHITWAKGIKWSLEPEILQQPFFVIELFESLEYSFQLWCRSRPFLLNYSRAVNHKKYWISNNHMIAHSKLQTFRLL